MNAQILEDMSILEEYFSDSGKGTVDRSQLYIGRVGSLENYKSFQ